jgi:hypothetical protein
MTTAVITSVRPHHGLVIVKVDGKAPDVALRLCGSDRSTVAKLRSGQKIRFNFQCDGQGNVFAIDVTAISSLSSNLGVDSFEGFPRRSKRFRAAGRQCSDQPDARSMQFGSCTRSCAQAALEELLSAPIIRRLMERDGVDPQPVRKLIATITRARSK